MKWTLVTGAAKGLGREIALQLGQAGKHVLIHYQNSLAEAEDLAVTLHHLNVQTKLIATDFSSLSAIPLFIEQLKHLPIEGIVNNVGNYLEGSPLTTPIKTAETLWQTNVFAPLALIQDLAPSLKAQGGSIVNIGMAGCDLPRANTHRTFYTMSKSALYLATRSLAKELAPHGVNVNMVSPGYMENSIEMPHDNGLIPMKRTATLSEVARVVMFLLDTQSRYITGQNIDVAGGLNL